MARDVRTASARDRAHMRRALALAERGWGQTAPNPMVGAVVVRDDVVVGEGWHTQFGDAHAEVEALLHAGELARGATLYTTLEPCNQQGKQPPCVDAILAAGVKTVFAAVRDPNPAMSGGLVRLEGAGVEVIAGVEEDDARELNAPFVFAFQSNRPWVTLKLAVSLDGAIADATRRPGWLTGKRSRAEVHRMRANVDAVAVGVGTALADNPGLTVRGTVVPRRAPLRVVFDRTARLPLDSSLVKTARERPVLVITDVPAPPRAIPLAEAGVEILSCASLDDAMRALRDRGVRSMMVEGGATIASALLDAGLVDRLVIFQAPVILGAGALPAFAGAAAATAGSATRLRIVSRQSLGGDVMTTYALTEPGDAPRSHGGG